MLRLVVKRVSSITIDGENCNKLNGLFHVFLKQNTAKCTVFASEKNK